MGKNFLVAVGFYYLHLICFFFVLFRSWSLLLHYVILFNCFAHELKAIHPVKQVLDIVARILQLEVKTTTIEAATLGQNNRIQHNWILVKNISFSPTIFFYFFLLLRCYLCLNLIRSLVDMTVLKHHNYTNTNHHFDDV